MADNIPRKNSFFIEMEFEQWSLPFSVTWIWNEHLRKIEVGFLCFYAHYYFEYYGEE